MGWDPSHHYYDDDVTGLDGDPFDTYGNPQRPAAPQPRLRRAAATAPPTPRAVIIAIVAIIVAVIVSLRH